MQCFWLVLQTSSIHLSPVVLSWECSCSSLPCKQRSPEVGQNFWMSDYSLLQLHTWEPSSQPECVAWIKVVADKSNQLKDSFGPDLLCSGFLLLRKGKSTGVLNEKESQTASRDPEWMHREANIKGLIQVCEIVSLVHCQHWNQSPWSWLVGNVKFWQCFPDDLLNL